MPRTSKSKPSQNVRESQLEVPFQNRLRRTITYVPAIIMLTVIFFLLADEPLGISDAMFGNAGDDDSTSGGQLYGGIYNTDATLSTFFTPSVMYWEPAIYGWAGAASLNPNLVATIIQIESCGNPYVTSNAGAQGLVQVIPSNFQLGDNQLDLNTNVLTGLQVFRDCLRWSADTNFDGVAEGDPDVGVALACYNGGPSVIGRPQSQWFQESRDYYVWGTGIWAAASGGQTSSTTLDQWLQAGGSRLCASAFDVQERYDPIKALIR
jgi:hypothetical protein